MDPQSLFTVLQLQSDAKYFLLFDRDLVIINSNEFIVNSNVSLIKK